MSVFVRLTLLVMFIGTSYCRDLRIGAFNLGVYGKTKASKTNVMEIIVKIIRRYDLLLLQEIRDATNLVVDDLLTQTNEDLAASNKFDMVRSGRLGRTKSKEEYVFFYRPGAGLHVDTYYVHDDGDEALGTDVFEREPFIVSFISKNTILGKFVLAGLHVDPDVAVQEINSLYPVFSDMWDQLHIADRMVIGDLNADCKYVGKKKWAEIPIKHDPDFTWLIPDGTDTTVAIGTHCAYDRFIATGPGWTEGIVPGSAAVYRFDEELGPMDIKLATAVSDHYPIEFLLAGKSMHLVDEL